MLTVPLRATPGEACGAVVSNGVPNCCDSCAMPSRVSQGCRTRLARPAGRVEHPRQARPGVHSY